jgi:hypothetical protein
MSSLRNLDHLRHNRSTVEGLQCSVFHVDHVAQSIDLLALLIAFSRQARAHTPIPHSA